MTAIALVASGCAVGPDFREPSAPDVDRYLRAGDPFATRLVDGVAQRFALAPVSADWWHAFGSPALDNVMETAIAA
ncbi:hypothetical protein ABTK60_19605, partial [Acinetobacter baumannii]